MLEGFCVVLLTKAASCDAYRQGIVEGKRIKNMIPLFFNSIPYELWVFYRGAY
jgi:hypothetical protein